MTLLLKNPGFSVEIDDNARGWIKRSAFFVWLMMASLRPGAIGNAAWAVDANTDKYHMAVASTTVTPFDLTTLKMQKKKWH